MNGGEADDCDCDCEGKACEGKACEGKACEGKACEGKACEGTACETVSAALPFGPAELGALRLRCTIGCVRLPALAELPRCGGDKAIGWRSGCEREVCDGRTESVDEMRCCDGPSSSSVGSKSAAASSSVSRRDETPLKQTRGRHATTQQTRCNV
jgi:hypothetical protein